VCTTADGGREDGIWRGDWRVSYLFGSLVSCNHEVGEDASVGGTHGVGEEADVEGAGQQTCVAVVTSWCGSGRSRLEVAVSEQGGF
jgi:hypothetical protein